MSLQKALKLRKEQAQLAQSSISLSDPPSPISSDQLALIQTKRRLQESMDVAVSWMGRVNGSQKRIVSAMIPQIVRMVERENPESIALFVRRVVGLGVYILEGQGATMAVAAYEMPADAKTEETNDGPATVEDLTETARAGSPDRGDRGGQDDAGGGADLEVLRRLPELADLGPGLEAEVSS